MSRDPLLELLARLEKRGLGLIAGARLLLEPREERILPDLNLCEPTLQRLLGEHHILLDDGDPSFQHRKLGRGQRVFLPSQILLGERVVVSAQCDQGADASGLRGALEHALGIGVLTRERTGSAR